MFNPTTFGQPINFGGKEGANELVTEHLRIETEFKDRLDQMTAADPNAKTYFCSDAFMYVFSKVHLETIINQLKDEQDCLIIFQGCRMDAGNEGKPTLIACAYNVDAGKTKLVHSKLKGGSDGLEHPGGGGHGSMLKPAGTTSSGVTQYNIKEEIDFNDIQQAMML